MTRPRRDGARVAWAALALVAGLLGAACEKRLAKVPVAEVPIDTPYVPDDAGSVAALTPDPGDPVAQADPDAGDTGGDAATPPAGKQPDATPVAKGGKPRKGGGGPVDVTPSSGGSPKDEPDNLTAAATAQERQGAAVGARLARSNKRGDLVAARGILSQIVFGGKGTSDDAKTLRTVCGKLHDSGCVAKCAAYIK